MQREQEAAPLRPCGRSDEHDRLASRLEPELVASGPAARAAPAAAGSRFEAHVGLGEPERPRAGPVAARAADQRDCENAQQDAHPTLIPRLRPLQTARSVLHTRRARETLLFRVATGIALLHAVDDAFLGRQPGVRLGQHVVAAVVALVCASAAVVLFPRLRPGLRAGIALVFGVFALTNGALHVAHVAVDAVGGSDLTGILATGAGAVLVGLGIWIPFGRRREGAATRRGRWVARVVAVVAGFVLLYAVVFPTSLAIVSAHKHREPIPSPPGAAYAQVSFESADGLELSGWYVESRNRAAVVVVHGGGGDRTGALDHAALLARHGYGVLVYDARGRGESEGSPTGAPGWGWDDDVAGALGFLARRPDVDAGRIGGLGISTGGDTLIEVAAERRDLRAVVADGATARSFDDYRNLNGLDEGAPFYWTLYTALRVLSGESPGTPLTELVARVSPTPLLLVSTGGSIAQEIDFNRVYAEAAKEPVELWELPEVDHTAAIRARSREYERRVVGFLDNALLRR